MQTAVRELLKDQKNEIKKLGGFGEVRGASGS